MLLALLGTYAGVGIVFAILFQTLGARRIDPAADGGGWGFIENDRRDYLLLVDANYGAVNDRVLDMVAEPIEVTGEIVRCDNLLYLVADPKNYTRIAGR